jgi:hypothetical protein
MERIEEWDENPGVSWWKESRIKLNKVIRKYNKWVDKHSDDRSKTTKLLNKVNKNLKMNYCNQDGGSGYKEELLNIKLIVERKTLITTYKFF